MAAAAAKKQKLPKFLQDYKREIKSKPFEERVHAYFNLSPYQRDEDSDKLDIVFKTFTKSEREEFYNKYQPIFLTISRYGDRVRAINGNCLLYHFYIEDALRRKDTYNYTADFLNIILPKVKKALEQTKEDDTRETLQDALSWLKAYREVAPTSINGKAIKINGDTYETGNEGTDKYLLEVTQTLKGLLSLLKCYIKSLREFLEIIGTPELLPQEFNDMEQQLRLKFRGIEIPNEANNPDKDKFPLYFKKSAVAREYAAIDYDKLPLSVDIFGENNIWIRTYKRYFAF